MKPPLRYGSKAWLARLPHDHRPVGKVGRLIVIRLPNGLLCKVIGGSPEAPTCMSLTPADRLELIRSMRVATVGADAPGTLKVTWVNWYNTSASASEQEQFDLFAKEIDAAGIEGLPGGSRADFFENLKFTNPAVYTALKNYQETGGRRALFAKETPVYSKSPISKPMAGGPIEIVGQGIVLHPGRYTYSDPGESKAFKFWLDHVSGERSVQVLRTAVAKGILAGFPILEFGSTPYYTNYEFLVAKDVAWNPSIPATPTWLPPGEDVQSYWGKPPPPGTPSLDPLIDAAKGAFDFSKQITTLALLLGAAYLIVRLTPDRSPRAA